MKHNFNVTSQEVNNLSNESGAELSLALDSIAIYKLNFCCLFRLIYAYMTVIVLYRSLVTYGSGYHNNRRKSRFYNSYVVKRLCMLV